MADSKQVQTPQLRLGELRVGDARELVLEVEAQSIDVIVTSPPYWRKRNYGDARQLGQENTPKAFVDELLDVMDGWKRVLKPTGSVFLNLGDSMRDGCVVGITTRFEQEAVRRGWRLAARIVWTRRGGMPDPQPRLCGRYEFVFHLFPKGGTPFVDTFLYGQHFVLSQGNVWHIEPTPSKHPHLAPFPEELPFRALCLACPERVCIGCGRPLVRQTERRLKLDEKRLQARRALELWKQSGLSAEHLGAVRSTGINDAGKCLRVHSGAGRNRAETMRLAGEAKAVLGGYFRELLVALPEQIGWHPCACGESGYQAGLVLDPFAGTGTTLRAAARLGRRALGFDLVNWDEVESSSSTKIP